MGYHPKRATRVFALSCCAGHRSRWFYVVSWVFDEPLCVDCLASPWSCVCQARRFAQQLGLFSAGRYFAPGDGSFGGRCRRGSPTCKEYIELVPQHAEVFESVFGRRASFG